MNKRFIINGTGGSGKDTFIRIFADNWNDYMFNISSIDPIKDIAQYGGWNCDKSDKGRKFLSDLKKVFIEYNNLPLKYVIKYIEKAEDKVIFIHIREALEIDKLKGLYPDIKTILIDRDIIKHGNVSDDNVYDYRYDYIIENNGGIEDLQESVEVFIGELNNEIS